MVISYSKIPNPEEPEALAMALAKAEEIGADMVVGTDPDSDRLGIAVRNLEGTLELLIEPNHGANDKFC